MHSTVAAALVACFAIVNLSGCGLQRAGPIVHKPVQPPAVPKVRAVPLDPQLRADAKAELIAAFNGPDPELRANAIEAAQQTLGPNAHAVVEAGLRDTSPKVRYAACLAAGQLQFKDLHDDVLGLAFETDRKIQLGARFALHRLGDTHLSHEFEKTARDPSPGVREDTAFLLGLTGDKSALRLLHDMRRDSELYVRVAVAEAQWRLGSDEGLELLAGGVSRNEVQLRIFCMVGLAAPKDRRVAGNLQGQLTLLGNENIPALPLIAARCLGDLGLDDGFGVALAHLRENDPQLRLLSASALGSIGRSDAQDYLRPLMKDADARVRLAAAAAVLKLKAPMTS